MYKMKDEYLTGIEMIDKEHERLFEIAEETYQLSRNEFIPDKYDRIHNLLEQLTDYTLMHFEHEEAYMQEIGYKRIFTQKIQHDDFRKKLTELTDSERLEGSQEEQDKVVDEILQFLTDWLVNHILNNDKLIGK